jgi:hypothetical protein
LQELDERAFLFVIEAGTDDGGLALISECQIDPLSLFSRPYRGHGLSFIGGYCETLLLRPGVCLSERSHRGPSSEGCLDGSPKAFHGALEVSAHSDDSWRSRQLQYHVRVMRNVHELCQSRPVDDGVVSTVEACHLEPQELGSIVIQSREGDGHVDVPEWVLPFSWHNTEEGSIRLGEVFECDPQG